MSKKILGLLLALCLVVGLLPVAAMAADGTATLKFGFTKLELTGYDTPIYYKNGTAELVDVAGNKFNKTYPVAGTADDWTAKFEWKSGEAGPTLTLNGFVYDEYNDESGKMGAKYDQENEEWTENSLQTYGITTPENVPLTIVLTGKDSKLQTTFGIKYLGPLTIKSEGDTKLTLDCGASGVTSFGAKGNPLTVDANMDINIRYYYNTAGTHMLQTLDADLTVNGGKLNLTCQGTMAIMAIVARDSDSTDNVKPNVIINGGTINAESIVGEAIQNGVLDSATGKVIINGGDLTLKPKEAVGIVGGGGVEINGGNVKIETPHYGIFAGTDEESADCNINGGTVEIYSSKTGKELEGGAFLVAPILGSKITGVAGTSADTAVAYNESLISSNYVKLSDSATVTPPAQTEAPTTGTQAPTQGATQAPTQGATQAPTQGATQAPTQGATQAPTQGATQGATQAPAQTENNNNPGTGDNGIVMFSALLLVAVFGIVATVAFGKKNSIAE